MANRLWFVMFGRGLVNPLDQHHPENPASHPELLDLLAREFVAHQFDIKWLLRELALTETYGRSSILSSSIDIAPCRVAFASVWIGTKAGRSRPTGSGRRPIRERVSEPSSHRTSPLSGPRTGRERRQFRIDARGATRYRSV